MSTEETPEHTEAKLVSRQTPRTDDAIHRCWNGGVWSPKFEMFARTLELEAAALRSRVEELEPDNEWIETLIRQILLAFDAGADFEMEIARACNRFRSHWAARALLSQPSAEREKP